MAIVETCPGAGVRRGGPGKPGGGRREHRAAPAAAGPPGHPGGPEKGGGKPTSRRKKAFRACEKKIAERGLEMKLVDVEYTFDNSKILFYFTADGRVDFRELVKDLAGMFRTRIELRQIGVRDEAKMLGGMGICGRPFCCGTFLGGFTPVSIKMAKEQGLSLNPVKISGACGRLMCCLKYEQEAYQDLLRTTPKVGALVSTPEGKGAGHRAEPVDPQAHHPAGQGPGRRPQGVQSRGGQGAAGREDQGGQKGIGRAETAGGELKSPPSGLFLEESAWAGGKTLAFLREMCYNEVCKFNWRCSSCPMSSATNALPAALAPANAPLALSPRATANM